MTFFFVLQGENMLKVTYGFSDSSTTMVARGAGAVPINEGSLFNRLCLKTSKESDCL